MSHWAAVTARCILKVHSYRIMWKTGVQAFDSNANATLSIRNRERVEGEVLTGVWSQTRLRMRGVPHTSVIARSAATKQSRGGMMRQRESVDCRAFSFLGSENGSQ